MTISQVAAPVQTHANYERLIARANSMDKLKFTCEIQNSLDRACRETISTVVPFPKAKADIPLALPGVTARHAQSLFDLHQCRP